MSPYLEAALYGSVKREALTLPVAFWHKRHEAPDGTASAEGGLAIKSNDTPIETLRRIVGFEEEK